MQRHSNLLPFVIHISNEAKHRELGVHISFVRSVHMDKWTPEEIQLMVQGGNAALKEYLISHGDDAKVAGGSLKAASTEIEPKYKTRNAEKYRAKLLKYARSGKRRKKKGKKREMVV